MVKARVTVRGFGPDYNMVTLNGRTMPAASLPAEEEEHLTQELMTLQT